jgi:hypothetical protein
MIWRCKVFEAVVSCCGCEVPPWANLTHCVGSKHFLRDVFQFSFVCKEFPLSRIYKVK